MPLVVLPVAVPAGDGATRVMSTTPRSPGHRPTRRVYRDIEEEAFPHSCRSS